MTNTPRLEEKETLIPEYVMEEMRILEEIEGLQLLPMHLTLIQMAMVRVYGEGREDGYNKGRHEGFDDGFKKGAKRSELLDIEEVDINSLSPTNHTER